MLLARGGTGSVRRAPRVPPLQCSESETWTWSRTFAPACPISSCYEAARVLHIKTSRPALAIIDAAV